MLNFVSDNLCAFCVYNARRKTPEETYYIFGRKDCLVKYLDSLQKPIIYFPQNNTHYQKGKRTKTL